MDGGPRTQIQNSDIKYLAFPCYHTASSNIVTTPSQMGFTESGCPKLEDSGDLPISNSFVSLKTFKL